MQQRNTNNQASHSLQQTSTAATKKAASLPCSSMGCLRFGTLEKNGLCDVCFGKKGNPGPNVVPAPQTNQQQSSRNVQSLHTTLPTEQNRQFGNIAQPASVGLHGPVQVSQTQSPPHASGGRRHVSNSTSVDENVQGLRCRGTNCTLFGTPEMNGYCSRCFLESTIPQSGPTSIPGNTYLYMTECALSSRGWGILALNIDRGAIKAMIYHQGVVV